MQKPEQPLARDRFCADVLARLGGRCCRPGCDRPAVDAHHIVESRLWPDGGYYLANGAPLCAEDRMKAETTEISADELRAWCGIENSLLPPQFEDGETIDRWGNPVLPNGTRLRGELFFDEAAQKALAEGNALGLFTHLVKHPKTWHMPDSPGIGHGDRILASMDNFRGRRVIMTEKRDGECTSLYADHMHARSLDSRHHPSRDWMKSYWRSICHDIPERYRVVGENLYASHSIYYSRLPTWFEGYFVFDDRNHCLPWDETLDWFALIGSSAGTPIAPVPILYDGIYDEAEIRARWQALLDADEADAESNGTLPQQREGYVLRLADGFSYRDFRNCVCKWVRNEHVQTDQHWMHAAIVPNGRRKEEP